ncbi:MAG: hypothetical protein JO062_09470 [Bryobacterales bacterium]|nr:hypothetical protein [Bryobacterales bacterium]
MKIVSPRSAAGVEGETCNVSSSGVAFTGEIAVQPGQYVEYIIQLFQHRSHGRVVRLFCAGTLLRKHHRCCAAAIERYEFLRESDH